MNRERSRSREKKAHSSNIVKGIGEIGSFFTYKKSTDPEFQQQLVATLPMGTDISLQVEKFNWIDKNTVVTNTNPDIFLKCDTVLNVYEDRRSGQAMQMNNFIEQFNPHVDQARNKYIYDYQTTSASYVHLGGSSYNAHFTFTDINGNVWDFGDEPYFLKLKVILDYEDSEDEF